ncbi:MAG: ComF family protein [Oscillibacter sp.]|nr:ComF family protein [Oscillibacter sp.]
MSLFSVLLDLLFPVKCPFCGRVQDVPGICPHCLESLPWTDEDHVLRELEPGLLCAAPLWYEGSVRESIRRFKFHSAVGAAVPLGGLIAQCAAEHFSGGFDTVTWVPVSAKRLRKRGYDQAQLLAENACRLWDTKPERLLRKIRDNPAQSSLQSVEARRRNTLRVYRPTGDCAGRRVRGRLSVPPQLFPDRAKRGKRGRKSERMDLHSGRTDSIMYVVTLWIRWRIFRQLGLDIR